MNRADLRTRVDNVHPMSPNSTYYKLSAALEAFVDSLPHQLEFSSNTLQVHFSTRSSSSYAVLHVTLFLARITLERRCLPDFPFMSPRALGPMDPPGQQLSPEEDRFYSESAERYMLASRDLVILMSSLEEWNSQIESPFIISAIERAARSGLYAYSFPWMDTRGFMTGVSRTPEAEPMGTGEETRKAIEFINSLKQRWIYAKESFTKCVEMQVCLSERIEKFIQQDRNGGVLQEKISKILPNQDERSRLFGMLMPPTPKPSAAVVVSHGRGPSSEVDILLSAASGATQEPVVAAGTERWMAVNTPAVSVQQQPAGPKSEEGGSLDALAGFAAQQGKIGNGKDEYGSRDVKMGDASVKKEEGQKEEGTRWIGPGISTTNWAVGVNASGC